MKEGVLQHLSVKINRIRKGELDEKAFGKWNYNAQMSTLMILKRVEIQ